MKTKPIKISFIAKAGIRTRMPKGVITKPIKIAFLTRKKIPRRTIPPRNTQGRFIKVEYPSATTRGKELEHG